MAVAVLAPVAAGVPLRRVAATPVRRFRAAQPEWRDRSESRLALPRRGACMPAAAIRITAMAAIRITAMAATRTTDTDAIRTTATATPTTGTGCRTTAIR